MAAESFFFCKKTPEFRKVSLDKDVLQMVRVMSQLSFTVAVLRAAETNVCQADLAAVLLYYLILLC